MSAAYWVATGKSPLQDADLDDEQPYVQEKDEGKGEGKDEHPKRFKE